MAAPTSFVISTLHSVRKKESHTGYQKHSLKRLLESKCGRYSHKDGESERESQEKGEPMAFIIKSKTLHRDISLHTLHPYITIILFM